MANLRDSDTLMELRNLVSRIKDTSDKMSSILEDNSDLFTIDELLDNVETLQGNVDKLLELSEKKDSPFVSDEELINGYSDFYALITTEYLALKATILKKQVERRKKDED